MVDSRAQKSPFPLFPCLRSVQDALKIMKFPYTLKTNNEYTLVSALVLLASVDIYLLKYPCNFKQLHLTV